MNWSLRFNLIQHGTTYQGLGKYESFPVRWVWLKSNDDFAWGCAWPPEADGLIFWLIPVIGETRAVSFEPRGESGRTALARVR
eukprot:GAHX01000317.1.p2 GENE.GAHX01000317.1~~GAHX01000317.1.p2  ORF type:complete len:83 (+),score=3.51 GAHX01000317.1:1048-1296(+)